MTVRNLVIVLGDQLDRDSAAFERFDPAQDSVWMAEVEDGSKHVRRIEDEANITPNRSPANWPKRLGVPVDAVEGSP